MVFSRRFFAKIRQQRIASRSGATVTNAPIGTWYVGATDAAAS